MAVAVDASESVAVGLEELSALLVWIGRAGSPAEVAPEDTAPPSGVTVDVLAPVEEEPDTSVGLAGLAASVLDGTAVVPVAESESALALSDELVLVAADAESVAETLAGLSVGADTPEGSELGTPHVAPSLAPGDAGAVAPAG